MRVIKTYNIASHVVEDLNDNVRRRYRSKWVEEAIIEKLKRKNEFDLHDIPTWEPELCRYPLECIDKSRKGRYS